MQLSKPSSASSRWLDKRDLAVGELVWQDTAVIERKAPISLLSDHTF